MMLNLIIMTQHRNSKILIHKVDRDTNHDDDDDDDDDDDNNNLKRLVGVSYMPRHVRDSDAHICPSVHQKTLMCPFYAQYAIIQRALTPHVSLTTMHQKIFHP